MPELGSLGTVRGALGDGRPYRELAIQIRHLNLARAPDAARLSSFRVYIRKVASGSMKVQSDFTRLCGLSGAHPVRREVLQGARRLLSAIEIPREQAR